jgi:hypothetical protein
VSAYQPPANSTFFHNKPATSNQPVVLFSQNKPAPAISHQPTDQAESLIIVRSREEQDPRDPTPTCPLTLIPCVSVRTARKAAFVISSRRALRSSCPLRTEHPGHVPHGDGCLNFSGRRSVGALSAFAHKEKKSSGKENSAPRSTNQLEPARDPSIVSQEMENLHLRALARRRRRVQMAGP